MQKQEHHPCAQPCARLLSLIWSHILYRHLPMRWNKPNIRNNLHDLLGRDKPSSTAWVRDQGLETVRQAMLKNLMGLSGCEVARMNMRLRYAADIEALWYLRTDLFNTLLPYRGQAVAQTLLDQVTPLFQGLFRCHCARRCNRVRCPAITEVRRTVPRTSTQRCDAALSH